MRKGALIAIIIIAVVVVGGVVGFLVYNNSMTDPGMNTDTGTNDNQQQSGKNLGFEDDQSDLVRQVDDGITVPGWKSLTVDDGTTTVYVDLYNPESNEGKYYLTYSLIVDGETLYTSKLIRPGEHVKEITLSRPLEKGTYSAVLHVQPYTADDAMTETNDVEIQLTLIAA